MSFIILIVYPNILFSFLSLCWNMFDDVCELNWKPHHSPNIWSSTFAGKLQAGNLAPSGNQIWQWRIRPSTDYFPIIYIYNYIYIYILKPPFIWDLLLPCWITEGYLEKQLWATGIIELFLGFQGLNWLAVCQCSPVVFLPVTWAVTGGM